MSKSFADRLSDELENAQQPEYDRAYRALRDIAEGIREFVDKSKTGQLDVDLEPGYVTNLGQQFRLCLGIPTRKWGETLLRAYIPSDGFPVKLDLGDEESVSCGNKQELDDAVLRFMKKPEITNRMSTVRELLKKP